jgi:anti-sigma factor ChrR (cupin superfamily)
MDTHPTPHPTSEILQAYGLGELDDASAEAVYKHLEDCPDCRHVVAEMLPDSFLGRLREAQAVPQPETGVADDPNLDSPTPSDSPMVSDDTQSAVPENSTGSSLQPGTFVGYFGDYELQRILGEGGMGIVYKARLEDDQGRPVSLG